VVGYSTCTDLLVQRYFVAGRDNQTAALALESCLALEEKNSLDWKSESIHKVFGVKLWEGLSK
jgi:hypothetical protein